MKTYKYTINGREYNVEIASIEGLTAEVIVNGETFSVGMEAEAEPEKPAVVLGSSAEKAAEDDAPAAVNADTSNALRAPLPGVITDIKVTVGDTVAAGDTVVVLEAMKMANNLEAEKGGKVTAVLVKVGENVMEDTPLVVIE